jgi:hypothetical protein
LCAGPLPGCSGMTWPPERQYLMTPEMQSWAQTGQAPGDGGNLVSGSADKPESAWRNGGDQWVVRGDSETRAFSTLGFRDGDHAARRIIGTTKTLTPEEAADPAFDLRVWRKCREPTYYLILMSGAKHRVSKDGPVRAILSPPGASFETPRFALLLRTKRLAECRRQRAKAGTSGT